MITFIDLTFDPTGSNAAVVVAKLQQVPEVTSVMGEHDAMFHWKTNTEFDERIAAIHEALNGTGATYRVFTVEDSYQSKDPVPWIGPLDGEPSRHPALSKGK